MDSIETEDEERQCLKEKKMLAKIRSKNEHEPPQKSKRYKQQADKEGKKERKKRGGSNRAKEVIKCDHNQM